MWNEGTVPFAKWQVASRHPLYEAVEIHSDWLRPPQVATQQWLAIGRRDEHGRAAATV